MAVTELPPGTTLDPPLPGAPPQAAAKPTVTEIPADTILDPPIYDQSMRSGDAKPLRPVLDDPKLGASNLGIARASLAPDVNDQIKRYAQQFNQPVENFGVINGEIVRWDAKANAYAKVVPTIGGGSGVIDKAARAIPQTAAGFGPALPSAAGAVAGAAAGPGGMSIPAAGGAAGLTDVARQAVDRWLAGEPVNWGSIDWGNAAGQAALNAGGQTVGVGVTKLPIFNRNPMSVGPYDAIKALDPTRQAATADLEKEAASRGVTLSAGQSTGLTSLLAQERQLGRYPETADTIFDFRQNQRNVAVPAAIRDEISAISPSPPGEASIGAFREGADTVVNNELKTRSGIAQTAYGKAFYQTDPATGAILQNADGSPMKRLPFYSEARFPSTDPMAPVPTFTLDELMQRPSMGPAIDYARFLAKEKGYDLTVPTFENGKRVADDIVPDWRSWDYIKQALDAQVQENTKPPELGGGLTTKGTAIASTRRDLLSVLDPANPDYANARLQFQSASGTLNDMLEGGLGMLKTLKDTQPMDRIAIVRRIFDARSLTPEEVSRMRVNFQLAGKQDEWNAGFANWLSDKLDVATKNAGTTGNLPLQFNKAAWQDPEQQRIIQAALGGDPLRVQGIAKLMQVVNASARGLGEGSPTATDTLNMNSDAARMIGKTSRILTRIVNPFKWTELPEDAMEGLATLRAPAKRVALAQTLLSGDAAPKLKQLAMLSPGQARFSEVLTSLLSQAGIIKGPEAITGRGIRTPADRAAPAAPTTTDPSPLPPAQASQ